MKRIKGALISGLLWAVFILIEIFKASSPVFY